MGLEEQPSRSVACTRVSFHKHHHGWSTMGERNETDGEGIHLRVTLDGTGLANVPNFTGLAVVHQPQRQGSHQGVQTRPVGAGINVLHCTGNMGPGASYHSVESSACPRSYPYSQTARVATDRLPPSLR